MIMMGGELLRAASDRLIISGKRANRHVASALDEAALCGEDVTATSTMTPTRTGLPVVSLWSMLVSMVLRPWTVSWAMVRIISLRAPGGHSSVRGPLRRRSRKRKVVVHAPMQGSIVAKRVACACARA